MNAWTTWVLITYESNDGRDLIEGVRLFQTLAAVTWIERSPMVERLVLIISRPVDLELVAQLVHLFVWSMFNYIYTVTQSQSSCRFRTTRTDRCDWSLTYTNHWSRDTSSEVGCLSTFQWTSNCAPRCMITIHTMRSAQCPPYSPTPSTWGPVCDWSAETAQYQKPHHPQPPLPKKVEQVEVFRFRPFVIVMDHRCFVAVPGVCACVWRGFSNNYACYESKRFPPIPANPLSCLLHRIESQSSSLTSLTRSSTQSICSLSSVWTYVYEYWVSRV